MLNRLDKYDYLTFLVGLLIVVKIRIVGVFSLSEFILLFMTIFSNTSQYKSSKYARRMIGMSILWCVGVLISSFYNDTSVINTLKGLFFVLVMVFIIPSCYKLLCNKPDRIILFYLGYGIGAMFAPYFAVDEEFSQRMALEVNVYYSVAALIHGIGFFIYQKGHKFLGVMICYAVSVAGLFFMARNPFLTGTIAVALLVFIDRKRFSALTDNLMRYRRKIPILFIVVLVSAYAAGYAYEYLASNGALGLDAQLKYYTQKSSGGNSIKGGRIDTFMGIELIKERPLFGYGSYAIDNGDKFHMEYAAKHGINYYTRGEDKQLPSHSHIVGAWVQNGILGGLFWIYILYLLWHIFISGFLLYEPRLLCLVFFQISALLWDICFSPFSDRVQTVFLLMLVFIIYENAQNGYYLNEYQRTSN